MYQYIVDFSQLNSTQHDSFWEHIKTSFELPDWCGHNPQAMWDMLTGYMGRPIHITIIGANKLPQKQKQEYDYFMWAVKKAADEKIWGLTYELIDKV